MVVFDIRDRRVLQVFLCSENSLRPVWMIGENVTLGWRFPRAASPDQDLLNLTGEIINNGKAGLLDIDLVQQQKVLSCYAGTYGMSDY